MNKVLPDNFHKVTITLIGRTTQSLNPNATLLRGVYALRHGASTRLLRRATRHAQKLTAK